MVTPKRTLWNNRSGKLSLALSLDPYLSYFALFYASLLIKYYLGILLEGRFFGNFRQNEGRERNVNSQIIGSCGPFFYSGERMLCVCGGAVCFPFFPSCSSSEIIIIYHTQLSAAGRDMLLPLCQLLRGISKYWLPTSHPMCKVWFFLYPSRR